MLSAAGRIGPAATLARPGSETQVGCAWLAKAGTEDSLPKRAITSAAGCSGDRRPKRNGRPSGRPLCPPGCGAQARQNRPQRRRRSSGHSREDQRHDHTLATLAASGPTATAQSAIHNVFPKKAQLSPVGPPNRSLRSQAPPLWRRPVARCGEKARRQTARKPGSVPPPAPHRGSGAVTAIPLERPLPDASCDRPERRREDPPGAAGSLPGGIGPRRLPLLLGLAPGGVFHAAAVAGGAVRSYRTVSPLPPARQAGTGSAVSFLWHYPWGRPRRGLPGTVPPWSPDFPLPAKGGERPSGRLAPPRFGRGRDFVKADDGFAILLLARSPQGLAATPTDAANSFLTFPANSGLTRLVVWPAVASIAVGQAI